MAEADLVIVGGGVAGLTAGLYAAWHGLAAVLIERMGTGGQIVNADAVENFPGFPGGIQGFDLGPRIAEQAMDLGLRVEYADVQSLRGDAGRHVVGTDGEEFRARAVIVAAGSTLARLGCPGEAEFEGRGVSYCAVCDGEFFRDQPVVVIGGGDSALDEARVLAGVASSVTIVVRDAAFDGAASLVRRVTEDERIATQFNSTVEAIEGGEVVERVLVADRDGGERRIECGGVFIYTGLTPNSEFIRDVLPVDAAGHIEVDAWMRTAVPGVFAAGDIRRHSARQLITAAGDGATAAIAAAAYLRTGDWPPIGE